MEHLHEVRTADQSAGMAKKDQQEGLPAQVVQTDAPAVEIDEFERPCTLTDCRRPDVTHAFGGIAADARCIKNRYST
jgi:hypothetical protein